MKKSDLHFMPPNFDFEGSYIEGILEKYGFDREVGSGSQGKAMKFVGENSGIEVIYKHNLEMINSSTQANIYGTEDDFSYLSFINERDFISSMSVYARLSAFVEEHTSDGNLGFDKGRFIFKHKELNPHDAMMIMSDYHKNEKVMNSQFAVSPILIDYGNFIYDKEGNRFCAINEPQSGYIRDLMLGCFERNNWIVPLYSFEEGETLDNLLYSCDQKMAERLAKNIIYSGMVLHSMGMLHRDIKPENIIISSSGKIKFLDFGITCPFSFSDRAAYLADMIDTSPLSNYIGNNADYIAKSWRGSRIFSPPDIYTDWASNKDDIFSIGMLCAVLLTKDHAFMENFSKNSTKDVKREYSNYLKESLDDGQKRLELEKKHGKFLRRHNNPLLYKISHMFHPDSKIRPPRMVSIAQELGMDIPEHFPPYINVLEVYQNERNTPHSKKNMMGEMENRLRSRGDITIIPFWEYENNAILSHDEENINGSLKELKIL
ncbi:MAG: AarF/UbiB family protein [Candidatus Woesearchaeota archaeon]